MSRTPTLDQYGQHDDTSGRLGRRTHKRTRSRLLLATALTAGVGVVGLGAGHAGAIVDGTATTANDNPWQVALVDGEGQFCGGSLVGDRVVVTAAHCVVGMPESAIQVRAGVTDLTGSSGQVRQVTGVVEHARYAETGTADIAMLVLDRPFDPSTNVAAIPTATPSEVAAATTARVTGWGSTSETADDTPAVLQSADVPLVGDEACDSQLGIDADDELCAGGTGTDSCYGDSGGPLTIDTPRGRVLAGVVSWGEECGGPTPGVYAEVPTFADWIAERVDNPDAPTPERLPADAGDVEGDWNDEWLDDEADDGGYWDDEFEGNPDDWYWDDELAGDWDDEFDDGSSDDGFDDPGYWDDEYGWCELEES